MDEEAVLVIQRENDALGAADDVLNGATFDGGGEIKSGRLDHVAAQVCHAHDSAAVHQRRQRADDRFHLRQFWHRCSS